MKYLIMLFLIAGCGVDVHVDPIKTDPITVTQTFTIDFSALATYCQNACIASPDFTTCTSKCYSDFLNILSKVVPNAP